MMNFDRPGGHFHDFAVAGEVIGPLAVDLDRRIAGRNLLDRPDEAGQQARMASG